LHPESKRGIVVFSQFTQPKDCNLCIIGLKSGKQLKNEGYPLERSIAHPYIFFRAPYCSQDQIDRASVETEIYSSYGELSKPMPGKGRVFIRVDPDKTYVFSSEIRAKFIPSYEIKYNSIRWHEAIENQLNLSRKLLTEYLKIIEDNKSVVSFNSNGYPVYNLFSSRKIAYQGRIDYPLDTTPINTNSEILVELPHLESHYFVKCDSE
jgi:hypothetical protein